MRQLKHVALLMAGTAFVTAPGQSPAQEFTTLVSFDATNGEHPLGSLTLGPDGKTLYGMTHFGGLNGKGVVFRIPVTDGAPTILASFEGGNSANPTGSLSLTGSTLYGVAGTVFSVPVTGGRLKTYGTGASGSLTLSGSTLYGVGEFGGAYNSGTIFSIPVTGGSPTILATFRGSRTAPIPSLRRIPTGHESTAPNPHGCLMLSGSTLFGMTSNSIFSISTNGENFRTLFQFDHTKRAFPRIHAKRLTAARRFDVECRWIDPLWYDLRRGRNKRHGLWHHFQCFDKRYGFQVIVRIRGQC